MASLADLAGTLCVHGLPIEVTPSGNTALCRRPDRSCGGCRTAELKAYAAQLNGFGASEVLVHSNHDDAGGNRPRRAVSSEKNNATFGGTVSPGASTARQHKSALSESSPLASNEGGDTGVGSAELKEKPPSEFTDEGAGAGDDSKNNSHSNGAMQDDMLRRVPPQNIDAEMSVLGSILIENEAIAKIGWLNVEAFYRESHREIYKAMLTLRAGAKPIDLLTLPQALGASLGAVGGKAYIRQLAAFEGSQSNIAHYAGIVRDMAIKRTMASNAMQIVDWAMNGVAVDTLIGEAERILGPIFRGEIAQETFPEPLTASQWYAKEESLYGRVKWVWDNILEGGGISVLAGKKGAGKSTFVRTLMLYAARGWALLDRNMQSSRVWYIDLEPGGKARKELMEKMGWCDDDTLHISTGSPLAGRPGLFKWLKDRIIANSYDLVVVDTMYKLLRIEGTNDYDKGIYGQIPIEEICRETGVHFMLIHHARKNPGIGALNSIAEEILGSVSVAATAGTVMLIRRRADLSTFQMDPPRYGEAIEGEVVLKKLESGLVEGAGSYGNQWFGWAKGAVKAALAERGEDWSKAEEWDPLESTCRHASLSIL